MKLFDIELIKLLPNFMRRDDANIGLAEGVDGVIKTFNATIKMMSTWDKIDTLQESTLDELAWELNILWYDRTAPIEVKREIVRSSDKVYQHLGTKWAVENVINTYFGEGHMLEWFEYEGEPGHFKILSSNPTITNEKINQFLNILNKVKRKSAFLDEIQISLTGQMRLQVGVALRETCWDTHTIGKPY